MITFRQLFDVGYYFPIQKLTWHCPELLIVINIITNICTYIETIEKEENSSPNIYCVKNTKEQVIESLANTVIISA